MPKNLCASYTNKSKQQKHHHTPIQKKDDHRKGSRPILTAASGHQLFHCINNCLESLGLVHSEVSQNLTVKLDTLRVYLTHKL